MINTLIKFNEIKNKSNKNEKDMYKRN